MRRSRRWRNKKSALSNARPGTLLYFGGAVHEVLPNGKTRVREDLVPGAPEHLWKPKWSKASQFRRRTKKLSVSEKKTIRHRVARGRNPDDGRLPRRGKPTRSKPKRSKPKNWIQKAHLKKGALHRQLGIPAGKRIPLRVLRRAAKAPGKLGQRARLALNLRAIGKTRR